MATILGEDKIIVPPLNIFVATKQDVAFHKTTPRLSWMIKLLWNQSCVESLYSYIIIITQALLFCCIWWVFFHLLIHHGCFGPTYNFPLEANLEWF